MVDFAKCHCNMQVPLKFAKVAFVYEQLQLDSAHLQFSFCEALPYSVPFQLCEFFILFAFFVCFFLGILPVAAVEFSGSSVPRLEISSRAE